MLTSHVPYQNVNKFMQLKVSIGTFPDLIFTDNWHILYSLCSIFVFNCLSQRYKLSCQHILDVRFHITTTGIRCNNYTGIITSLNTVGPTDGGRAPQIDTSPSDVFFFWKIRVYATSFIFIPEICRRAQRQTTLPPTPCSWLTCQIKKKIQKMNNLKFLKWHVESFRFSY